MDIAQRPDHFVAILGSYGYAAQTVSFDNYRLRQAVHTHGTTVFWQAAMQ